MFTVVMSSGAPMVKRKLCDLLALMFILYPLCYSEDAPVHQYQQEKHGPIWNRHAAWSLTDYTQKYVGQLEEAGRLWTKSCRPAMPHAGGARPPESDRSSWSMAAATAAPLPSCCCCCGRKRGEMSRGGACRIRLLLTVDDRVAAQDDVEGRYIGGRGKW